MGREKGKWEKGSVRGKVRVSEREEGQRESLGTQRTHKFFFVGIEKHQYVQQYPPSFCLSWR